MMRRIVNLAWISIVLSAVPTAEAGFRWLGDWEVTRFGGGGSEFSANSNPSGHFVYLSASASYPGDEMRPDESAFSEVAISRSFEITDAPTGLPATFLVDWTASVDYLPRTHGHAGAAVGLPVAGFAFVAATRPYGYSQEFSESHYLETRLDEGIYSLSARSWAGFEIGPGANFAGLSRSSISIQITVVPEPASALLVGLGGILLGAARLAKRG
jgi:hypothetical protein